VPAGQTCSLLGPSGAGKTTLVRAIAGLEPAARGRVVVADRDLTDIDARHRRIGLVFQEPRLFPNLTVLDNVAYRLRVARVAKPVRHRQARELLEEVGLGDRGTERPTHLSGGEQQRVALARALCGPCDLLVLDEPLSAVDGPVRSSLRELVRSICSSRCLTALVVTHDLSDATALGDLVAVMDAGRIIQSGSPDDVLRRPRSPGVAALAGNPNVVTVRAESGWLRLGHHRVPTTHRDGPVALTVRPEDVRLDDVSGEPARIEHIEQRAERSWVRVVGVSGALTASVVGAPQAGVGDVVCVGFDRDSIWVFPDQRWSFTDTATRSDAIDGPSRSKP
jgi:ABC-type sulfate/molybdate transport systems ATPase subunit